MTQTLTAEVASPSRRRLPLIALGLLLVFRTTLLFVGDGLLAALFTALGRPRPWETGLLWTSVSVVVVDLLTLGVLASICRSQGRRLRDLLGVVRLRRDVPIGLLLAFVLLAALFVGTYLGNLVVYAGPPPQQLSLGTPPLWLGIWTLVVMPVTLAAAEELFYRGFLLSSLSERWGWWPAAVVVSVAFGLQHAAFSATSVQAAVARVIATAVGGFVLALLARKLGRLMPLIVGHWLADVIGLGLPMLLLSLGFAG